MNASPRRAGQRDAWPVRRHPPPCVRLAILAVLACAGCSNPLKPRIDAEARKVAEAKDRFNKIRKEVEDDLKQEPDLFQGRQRYRCLARSLPDRPGEAERCLHGSREAESSR